MKLDGIIFDLDGTLWDAVDRVLTVWNETIERHLGVKDKLTAADMKSVMGLVLPELAARFFPDLTEARRMEIVRACSDNECAYLEKHGARLYEQLEDTLGALAARHKLYIVSNCQSCYLEAFFTAHRLQKYFSDYECAGRTGLTKGENIKLIMARNRLSKPVYVGDTGGDLAAARFAGVTFVYAGYGFGTVAEYDYKIDRIAELPPVVADIDKQ